VPSSAPFALSLRKGRPPAYLLRVLSKGVAVVVEMFGGPLTVGWGLPGGKLLSLSRQRK